MRRVLFLSLILLAAACAPAKSDTPPQGGPPTETPRDTVELQK